jgi:hypothetical protein
MIKRPAEQAPAADDIARYAYFLWELEGRAEGRAEDYWLQAEAQLRNAPDLPPPAPTRTDPPTP